MKYESTEKKPKKIFFRNSIEKKISDIRALWKEIKLYFSYIGNMSNKIMLVHQDKIMREDKNYK